MRNISLSYRSGMMSNIALISLNFVILIASKSFISIFLEASNWTESGNAKPMPLDDRIIRYTLMFYDLFVVPQAQSVEHIYMLLADFTESPPPLMRLREAFMSHNILWIVNFITIVDLRRTWNTDRWHRHSMKNCWEIEKKKNNL